MANFRVWIETTRKGSFRVRSRDKYGKRDTHNCVEKHESLTIEGRAYTGKTLANFYADQVIQKHHRRELGEWDLSEKLEDLMESYFLECEGNNYSSYTVQHKRNSLEPFLRENNLEVLAHLNHEMILAWREAMQRQGLAVPTVRGRLADVRTFLNWLVDHQKIKESPFGKKMMPKDKEPEPKFYTAREFMLLDTALAELNRPTRILCNLAHSAGLRKAEALGAEWSDIEVAPNGRWFLRVRREIAKGKRKGRTVPLDDGLKALLGPIGAGLIVGLRRYQADHYFAMGRRLAGIRQDLDIHGLRHTFAKNFLQGGGNLKALKDLMGHARTTTTEIYSQLEMSHYEEGIDASYTKRLEQLKTDGPKFEQL